MFVVNMVVIEPLPLIEAGEVQYTLAKVKRLRQKRHRVDFAGIEPAKSIAIHPLPKRKESSGETGINY